MFDGIPFADLAPPTLLGIVVLFMLMGRIVPRSALNDKIKEAEKWQKAYEIEREARITAVNNSAVVLEYVKTVHNIIVPIFGDPKLRETGGTYVVPTISQK